MVGLLKGIGPLKTSLVVKVLAYRVVGRPSRAGNTRQRVGGIGKITLKLMEYLSAAHLRPFARGRRYTGGKVTFQFSAGHLLIEHGMQFGVELVKSGMDDAQFLTGFRYPFG